MSKLTDAIKNKDIATALALINGNDLASRSYKHYFTVMYGDLLQAQENLNSRPYNLIDDLRLNWIVTDGSYIYNRKYKDVKNFGRTPIQLAAEHGLLEVVNALLAAGVPAEVNWGTAQQFSYANYIWPEILSSPLHLALANGHDAVAIRLIDAGANVHSFVQTDFAIYGAPNKYPWLPNMHSACGSMAQYGFGASTMYIAAAFCSLETINKLYNKDAKIGPACIGDQYVSDADYGRASVLMHAVAMRKDEESAIIENLLNLGADPNKFTQRKATDRSGQLIYATCHTALSLAVKDGKKNMARALMLHGATLWPQNLCRPEFIDAYGQPRWNDVRWFDVKPEIIIAAQQIAREIGLELQRPANYPDVYGKILVDVLPAPHRPQPRLGNINFADVAGNIEEHNLADQEFDPEPRRAHGMLHVFRRFTRALGVTYNTTQSIIPAVRAAIGHLENLYIDSTSEIGIKFTELKRLNPNFQQDQLLASFLCPISTELMREPVMTDKNQTYDRRYIASWLARSNQDPLTNTPLANLGLRENIGLKHAIVQYLDQLIAAARANQVVPEAVPITDNNVATNEQIPVALDASQLRLI